MVAHLARNDCEASNAKRIGMMIICCGLTVKRIGMLGENRRH